MKMVLPDGNRPSRSPCLGILPPQLIVVVPIGHVREKRGIEGVRQDDLIVRSYLLIST
jgi:hypothetical protein